MPFGISTISGLILCCTHDGSHYKSEWMADDGFVLTMLFIVFTSCIISILSLSLLLNKIPFIKAHALLSFSSWLLLPGSLCLIIIYEETLNFIGEGDID